MLTPANTHRLCVVLVATRNSLNIGAAARAMSNFGVLDLRVVRPWEAAFREARSAVGAEALLQSACVFEHVADAIADCTLVVGTSAGSRNAGRRSEDEHPTHPLQTAAPLIRSHLEHRRAAILFGSEKFGLSNDDLSHCDWLLHIPTRTEHLSMNLGQAVAVCMWELTRSPVTAAGTLPAQHRETASAEERERLTNAVMESLALSGYMEKHRQTTLHAQVRRMIIRMQLDSGDIHAILGMLHQTHWKMRLKE